MKLLRRNTTEFEYLPYEGAGSDLNDDGDHTGDYSRPEYGDPVTYRGTISSPSGRENQTFYGEDIRYTHTLVMDDVNVGIKEYGLVRWKNDLYDIVAVRPSLNVMSIALKKQTVDHAEGEPDG